MLHGTVGLFVAAAVGYWLLERAEAHKGDLKRIGQFLGWLIIVGSLIGVACRLYALASGRGLCPMDYAPGKGWFCPYSKNR